MLNDKDKKKLIRQIFEGSVTIASLPINLYKKTAEHLMDGVDIGFGDYSNDALYNELKTNIYVFSGAKTYTQVKDISSLILDGDKLRPFNEFKKLALEKYDVYNNEKKGYLQAEYETAVGQSQTAVKWQDIEETKKDFPYLQRTAVMDANTSPECVMLNNIIAPVGDPFWNTRSPLTHFRCRCIIQKIDRFTDVNLSSKSDIKTAMKQTEHINPLFKGNAGKDKVIFNESHPYFSIEPKDKNLAKRNFNLPL